MLRPYLLCLVCKKWVLVVTTHDYGAGMVRTEVNCQSVLRRNLGCVTLVFQVEQHCWGFKHVSTSVYLTGIQLQTRAHFMV